MTNVNLMDSKCSVCGKVSQQPVLFSSNQLGYQDMDTRPSEMYRNTMETWVLECPHCGYVANQLEEKPAISVDFIKSDNYKNCDGINFKSKLSKTFYKSYLIEKEKSDDINTFFVILQCAWTCDDANDKENAKIMRQIAIKLADKILDSNNQDNPNLLVIKSDLLRRIGDYDRLIEEYENLSLDDDLLDKIVGFQVQKAREKDDKCYTLKEVL